MKTRNLIRHVAKAAGYAAASCVAAFFLLFLAIKFINLDSLPSFMGMILDPSRTISSINSKGTQEETLNQLVGYVGLLHIGMLVLTYIVAFLTIFGIFLSGFLFSEIEENRKRA